MKKILVAAAAFVCVPGVAAAQDAPVRAGNFDGVRVEGRLGWETPTVSDSGNVYKIESDISFGGEVGFDFAVGGNVVVGPYAVYDISNVNICDGADCLEEDGNLAGGLRIGYAASDNVLVYGKVGYARIDFTATTGAVSVSEGQEGVQGAIGVNVNLSRNVYASFEANYADYGDFFGISLQRRHVAAGIGVRF